MHGFIEEIGIALIASTILGLLTQRLGQPMILGYFLTGALIGPQIGFQWVKEPMNIEIISELGLVLLLFVIGLEMNISKTLRAGKQILVAGIGQFVLCVVFGLFLFYFLFPSNALNGLYLSFLCALSSTAIVVKLLYDKMELDTLSGRITLGILVLQDIWAVLILAFQPNLEHPQTSLFLLALGKCALLGVGSYALGKYVLTPVFQSIAKSPELIVATSLGWCALIAGLASILGLSREMGALIAGAVIAVFPYSIFVSAKVLPLRDFFLTLFFVSLGMTIPYPTLPLLAQALGLSVFIFGSRFLSIYPLLQFTGAGRRTAFITSLNLSQISEFSLVIAALGITFKHIDDSIMSLIVYTMILTSILSSYLIQFSHPLYLRFETLLRRLCFDFKKHAEEKNANGDSRPIVLLGFNYTARALMEEIAKTEPELFSKILVVDYNTEILHEIRSTGMEGVYGDISHLDTLQHARIGDAKMILSTIPDMRLKGVTNADLVRFCRSLNPQAVLIVTSETHAQFEKLLELGATEVVSPYSLTGKYLCQKLKERN